MFQKKIDTMCQIYIVSWLTFDWDKSEYDKIAHKVATACASSLFKMKE